MRILGALDRGLQIHDHDDGMALGIGGGGDFFDPAEEGVFVRRLEKVERQDFDAVIGQGSGEFADDGAGFKGRAGTRVEFELMSR